jgi:hypothetical protein
MPGIWQGLRCQRESICRPASSVYWMTHDLPSTLAGRMMGSWQQHPLSRESPSSLENAGVGRAFVTCVSASKTFLKCSLPGRQRMRFLLTTLTWNEKISAPASSTPPSISTIPSSSDRRMACVSSSMLSCRHRWHVSEDARRRSDCLSRGWSARCRRRRDLAVCDRWWLVHRHERRGLRGSPHDSSRRPSSCLAQNREQHKPNAISMAGAALARNRSRRSDGARAG